MAVEVSQVALGLPSGWLVGAQTVGAFTQNADADVTSVGVVQVAQVYMTAGTGAVVRDATAAQTVGAFTQTATAERVSAVAVDVSWVTLQMPDSAVGTNDATAGQTVGSFITVGSMTDIIGSISGGGTISNELPHRSTAAAQAVSAFQTSASAGEEGTLGPALLQAQQFVAAFTQAASADARADASATQTVSDFTTSAYMYDVTPPRKGHGGGGRHFPKIRRQGKRFLAEVEGVTIVADTLAELQRKVQQLVRDVVESVKEAVQAPRKATKVVEVADPVPVTPEPIPVAEVERMVSDFIAQQQALVDQYQAEVANLKLASVANTASLKASMMREVEARVAQASSDMDAVVALLMDESIPMESPGVSVNVMLPRPLEKPKPEPQELNEVVASKGKGLGDALTAALSDIVKSAGEEHKTHADEKVKPLMSKMDELRAEIDRLRAPREVVRDEKGRATHVMIGDELREIRRDKAGRIQGI